METISSLPYLQLPATGLCPELEESNLEPQSHSTKMHFNISSHLRLGLPNSFFLSGLATYSIYTSPFSPVTATFPYTHIHL
jgi:hypothetical protein